MEQHHRNIILENMEGLVKDADLDSIRDTLLKKGVFNKRMVEPFKNKLHDVSDRKRDMFLYVKTRGPEAFSKLIDTLMETGHFSLAKLLDPSCDPEAYLTALKSHGRDGIVHTPGEDEEDLSSGARHCHPSILPQYMLNENPDLGKPFMLDRTSVINLGTEPAPIIVKMATERLDRSKHPELHVYPMGSHPKGLALLINNVEFDPMTPHTYREGAQVDEDSLTLLFTQLGYTVTVFQNQGKQDMMNIIRDFARREELRHVCSLVVVVMSHGTGCSYNNSYIFGSDGLHIETSDILEQFSSSNCPAMINKPKIFIFQACEGRDLDFGVEVSDDRKRTQADGVMMNTRVRSLSDVLVANSTLPGYASHRDVFLGTWFIQAICEVFMKYACTDSIEDMLKMVDMKLSQLQSESGSKQTSCYRSVGFQKFYFNPGLYDKTEAASNGTSRNTNVVVESITVDVNESLIDMTNGNAGNNGL